MTPPTLLLFQLRVLVVRYQLGIYDTIRVGRVSCVRAYLADGGVRLGRGVAADAAARRRWLGVRPSLTEDTNTAHVTQQHTIQ